MPGTPPAGDRMEYTVWLDDDDMDRAFVQKGGVCRCPDGTAEVSARGAPVPLRLSREEVRFWDRLVTFWAEAATRAGIVVLAVGDD